MVVFDGYLTDNANKFFIKKMLDRGSILIVVGFAFTIPIWAFLSINVGAFVETMSALLFTILFSPLIFRLCVSKKERQRYNLKKVSINDGIITAVSDKTVISNNITHVKEVRDYGDFYYIVLPGRYISFMYVCVCQKNLLSKGSLEEFEALFECEIVRINHTNPQSQSGDGSKPLKK